MAGQCGVQVDAVGAAARREGQGGSKACSRVSSWLDRYAEIADHRNRCCAKLPRYGVAQAPAAIRCRGGPLVHGVPQMLASVGKQLAVGSAR